MTQSNYVLITILVCALCTQVTRWLPFLLFGGKKEVPGLVRYLGTILPAAIMAVLVVYCLKGITPLAYPYGLPELISVAVVVGLHLCCALTNPYIKACSRFIMCEQAFLHHFIL